MFRWILRVLRVIKSLFKVGNVNNDENMKRYFSDGDGCRTWHNDLYIFLYLAPWGPETIFVFSVFLWGLEIFPAFLSSKRAQSKGVKLSLEVYFKVDCFLQISVISSLQPPVGAFVRSVIGMVYERLGSFLEEIWYSPGMFRLRNLDLGFESRISDLATKYKIQNQISTFIVEIQPQGGFQLRYPKLDFVDFLLYRFIGKSEKGFVKLFLGTLVFFYLLCTVP